MDYLRRNLLNAEIDAVLLDINDSSSLISDCKALMSSLWAATLSDISALSRSSSLFCCSKEARIVARRALNFSIVLHLMFLVAGAGGEPTTFRL